jgi:hypothetical protein
LEDLTRKRITLKPPANFNTTHLGEKTFPGYLLWNGSFNLDRIE